MWLVMVYVICGHVCCVVFVVQMHRNMPHLDTRKLHDVVAKIPPIRPRSGQPGETSKTTGSTSCEFSGQRP